MGRPRKHRLDLPEYVYFQDGRYLYRPKGAPSVELGPDYGPAMEAYGRLFPAEKAQDTPVKRRTMAKLGDEYMKLIARLKAGSTHRGNIREWKKLRPAFGHLFPEECTPTAMYAYMEARGTRRQAAKEKALLSHMLTYAVFKGELARNPLYETMNLALIGFTKRARRRRVRDREIEIFLRGANEILVDYIDVKEMTGLRKGDILTLEPAKHFTDEGLLVMPHKGRRRDPETGERVGKERVFPWTADLAAWRERALGHKRLREKRTGVISPYVFATRTGRPYYNEDLADASSFEALWRVQMRHAKAAAAAAGWVLEHFTEHDVRAKAGTEAERAEGGRGHKLLGNSPQVFSTHYDRDPEVVQPMPRRK